MKRPLASLLLACALGGGTACGSADTKDSDQGTLTTESTAVEDVLPRATTTTEEPTTLPPTTAVPVTAAKQVQRFAPTPRPTDPPTAAPSAYYKNCDAARDAGAAPLHRGDPGYRSELDRDDDGVACE